MSYATNDNCVSLGIGQTEDLQPLPRFVNLVLRQAVLNGAERIEFSLRDAASQTGFSIAFSGKSLNGELAPVPAQLFDPAVVVLCNYASLPYYATGQVEGRIHTKQPESHWLLSSDNLKKHVLLTKT